MFTGSNEGGNPISGKHGYVRPTINAMNIRFFIMDTNIGPSRASVFPSHRLPATWRVRFPRLELLRTVFKFVCVRGRYVYIARNVYVTLRVLYNIVTIVRAAAVKTIYNNIKNK